MYISKMCKEMRESNPNIKTQMRFNKHDVEVLTKSRGSSEPYKVTPLTDICGEDGKVEDIPSFDDKIKWNMKKDRLPRNTTSGSPIRGLPPSMRVEDDRFSHQLSRTNSLNNAPKKRQRKENDMDIEKEPIVSCA